MTLSRQRLAFVGSQQPLHESKKSFEQVEGQVCIANIGPRERRRRLMSGIAMLALGISIAAVLVVSHVPALWRLPLFLLFYGGASGVFQWREKT
jgi:hypothetical protein